MRKITLLLFTIISLLISCSDDDNTNPQEPLVLDFEISVNSDSPPAEVTITNNTTGATSYNWLFTNGTPTSSIEETPDIITYINEGEFIISLEATNGTDTESISKTFSLESNEINYSGEWIGTQFLIDEPYDFNNDGILGTDYKIELPCLIQNITLNSDGTGLFKANIHSGQLDGSLICVEYQETPLTWNLNENGTIILLTIFDETAEIVIVDENTVERFSEALLDEDIGISGKVVYERE